MATTQPLAAVPSAQSAGGSTTSSLIQQALRLTAQRKLPEAEALYHQLCQKAPEEGYPLLARFLNRSGRTTAAQELLNSPEVKALSPLAQARTAVTAEKPEQAIEILKQAPPDPKTEYQVAAFLAQTLHNLKQSKEGADVLVQAALSPTIPPADRRDLFRKLQVIGGPAYLRTALPGLAQHLVTSSTIEFPSLRESVVEAMTAIAGSSEYGAFHDHLDAEKQKGAVPAWLYALSMIRKGDAGEARAILDRVSSQTLTAREKVVVFEELALMLHENTERAISLYQAIIPLASDPDRVRLVTAQLFFRMGRHSEAASVLLASGKSKLEEGEEGVFKNVLLSSLAKSYPNSPLVAMYEREAAGLSWEKVRELAEAPFVTLNQEYFPALGRELDARVKSTTAPAELHVLRISLANRMGDNEALIGALEDYLAMRPKDVNAITDYADAAAHTAYRIVAEDPFTSPPAETLKRVGDRAAKALWLLISEKPYIPEPYAKLIELYRLYGQPEKAEIVPMALARSTTATAEEVHLAAFVYSQSDMAPQAIPLYERALKMEPNNTRFRLNYAGSLTRVGRHKEADAIYRDIIEKGAYGKQYHAHEVYANSIRNSIHLGYQKEFFAFLRSLIPKKDIPQHDYYLLELGKVMLGLEFPEEAIVYFQALHDQYPKHAYEASDFLVQAHVFLGKFEEAERLLAKQEKESTDTASLIVVRTNYAVTRAARGDLASAVEAWKRLARDFPGDRSASRALIAAAQAVLKEGRLRQATSLLEEYLALKVGDPDGESSARELLTDIRMKNFPSEILVKSALEDVGVTTTTAAPSH